MKDITCEENRDCFLVDVQPQAETPADLITMVGNEQPVETLPTTNIPKIVMKSGKQRIKSVVKRILKKAKSQAKDIKGRIKKKALSTKKSSGKNTRTKVSPKNNTRKVFKKPIKDKR